LIFLILSIDAKKINAYSGMIFCLRLAQGIVVPPEAYRLWYGAIAEVRKARWQLAAMRPEKNYFLDK
ncbi:MAG: hypothetical protein II030_01880, partial [Treponema sp.]|nr:hypothetical protein [Treponema sp.]